MSTSVNEPNATGVAVPKPGETTRPTFLTPKTGCGRWRCLVNEGLVPTVVVDIETDENSALFEEASR